MAKIKLEPSVLLTQAGEMESLGSSYEGLFSQVSSILNQANSNWSPNLANNFAGKISSAQKSFAGVVEMLDYGATAARTSARNFESIDSYIAKALGGAGVKAGAGLGAAVGGAASTGAKKSGKSKKKSKSIWDKAEGFFKSMTKDVSVGVCKTVNLIDWAVSSVVNDYQNKGLAWKILKTGAAVVSIAGAASAAALALGSVAGSGGLTGFAAVVTTIHSVNTISNSFVDMWNIWGGDKEQVGQVNILKSMEKKAFGEKGGELFYALGTVTSTAFTLSALAGKVTQAKSGTEIFSDLTEGIGPTNGRLPTPSVDQAVSTTAQELGKGAKGLIDITGQAIKEGSSISEIQYQIALLKNEVPHVVELSKWGSLLYDVGKKTKSTIDTILKPMYENSFPGEDYDSIPREFIFGKGSEAEETLKGVDEDIKQGKDFFDTFQKFKEAGDKDTYKELFNG